MRITRRDLLRGFAGGVALQALGCGTSKTPPSGLPDLAMSPTPDAAADWQSSPPPWHNRGIILTPADLTLSDWPERAARAGLTTLSMHTLHPNAVMVPFIQSSAGQSFLDRCAKLGLGVEYELHAVADLLPRSLYSSNPSLFRTDKSCQRVGDANLCVHNPETLAIAADNAIKLCKILRSSTDRYFLWPDDNQGQWCECACCAPLQPSDQALTLENHLLTALRSEFPKATVAHLAYTITLEPPATVKPLPGVFLEFCPFYRRYDIPFDTPSDMTQAVHLAALDANLAVFGSSGAQALEFWMDASKISGWQHPAKQLPFDAAVLAADVRMYHQRGVQDITSFGVFLDADYVSRYGDPPIDAYGAALQIP